MVWHHHPGDEPVTVAIEMEEVVFHNAGAVRVA